jgi:hypothetical protein
MIAIFSSGISLDAELRQDRDILTCLLRLCFESLPCLPGSLFGLRAEDESFMSAQLDQFVDVLIQEPSAEEKQTANILNNARQFVRSIFRIEGAAMIGVSHWDHEPDDRVWFLNGLSVPVILRPLPNGCFSLIGGIYVQMQMYGEILDTPWPEHEQDIELE